MLPVNIPDRIKIAVAANLATAVKIAVALGHNKIDDNMESMDLQQAASSLFGSYSAACFAR